MSKTVVGTGEHRPQRWIVWDSDGRPERNDNSVIYWSRKDVDGGLDLLDYVEKNGAHLRAEFLKTVNGIGELSVQKRSIIDWLILDDGDISLWWSGLITEQNYSTCPEINDIMKLLALKEVVATYRIKEVRVVSQNRSLAKAIQIYCAQERIQCSWDKRSAYLRRRGNSQQRTSIKGRIYQRLPTLVQGILLFGISILSRWGLRGSRNNNWHSGEQAIFILSYFLVSSSDELTEIDVMSKYWGELPTVLNNMGLKANWLDLYLRTDELPVASLANQRIEDINRTRREDVASGTHNFLFAYLSLPLVRRVIIRYIRMCVIWIRLGVLRGGPLRSSDYHALWPLLGRQWRESLVGPTAVTNLLMAELFREALSEIPRQRLGLYLYEGKGWEWSFISAWRRNGHGRLIGVAHAMTRFWFLPYFHDVRILKGEGVDSLPQPDLIAVNGPMARKAHMEGGWPEEMLVECEALRYFHLHEIRNEERVRAPQAENLRVLVLGEHETDTTNQILDMLKSLPTPIANVTKYWLKPHPVATQPDLYRIDSTSVINGQLSDLINDFEIVVAGTSGAALDAVLLGSKVVVVVPPSSLNFSPLRGNAIVKFAYSTQELGDVINSFRMTKSVKHEAQDFFYLNDDLALWQRVVEVGTG